MVLTDDYQKLILKYFISAVGEFQNINFGFHIFGPFIKLAPHGAAAPGAKFLSILYIDKFSMCTPLPD